VKLARKLILGFMAAVVVALAVHGYYRARRDVAQYQAHMEASHGTMGRVLRAALVQVLREQGEAPAQRMVEYTDSRIQGVTIRWLPIASAPPLAHDGKDWHVRTGDVRYTYVPVVADKTPAGVIELSQPTAEEDAQVRAIIRGEVLASLTLAAIASLVAVGIGYFFIGRPVRLLTEKAKRIGDGDLTGDIELRQDDELSQLARELNATCERLARARERVAEETDARLRAIEQLRHADRLTTIGTIASGIAHELGTPLGVVAMRAKMIADGEVSAEEAAENGRIVWQQAGRMKRLIRQLLDYARRDQPHKKPVDMAQVVGGVTTVLESMAQRSAVELKLPAPDASAPVVGDRGQLEQVFTNLIVNAIQATPPGGRVEVKFDDARRDSKDFLRVSVEDNGQGISAEELSRIFEPFFTTKEAGTGTGLGLPLAEGIVRDHGGVIEVESEMGRGSRFAVLLPRMAS
jgi:signal transduction histidine kinase